MADRELAAKALKILERELALEFNTVVRKLGKTEDQVKGVLRNLEELHLVEAKSVSGQERAIYRITAEGVKEVQGKSWLDDFLK